MALVPSGVVVVMLKEIYRRHFKSDSIFFPDVASEIFNGTK